jgi:hypothetical protein
MRPEEQDAEVTQRTQHVLSVPNPENPCSWLPWYRYYRQLGYPVSEAVLTAWWVAQPWRRIVQVWWWVSRPWRVIYEVSRDTWREYRDKKNSGDPG